MNEDPIKVPKQTFALVSFLPQIKSDPASRPAMMIRGAFETSDEAREHVKKIMEEDDTVDVFMTEMYRWNIVPPNYSDVEASVYNDEYLQKMMSEYDKNQKEGHRLFEERKQKLVDGGKMDALGELVHPSETAVPKIEAGPSGSK